MTDSYTELVLPFGSSPELLEKYTNASGGIRTGKYVFLRDCTCRLSELTVFVSFLLSSIDRLMEHLDSLAGSIAYKHMLGPGVQRLGRIEEIGFYIVTASVDR